VPVTLESLKDILRIVHRLREDALGQGDSTRVAALEDRIMGLERAIAIIDVRLSEDRGQ
jgi:hypothetical protein